MKHSRSKTHAHICCSFSRKVSSARREFARFLPKCSHVGRTCTRKNEKGILLIFPHRSDVKERKGNGKARRYSKHRAKYREEILEFPCHREVPKIRIISRRERFMGAFSSLLRNCSLFSLHFPARRRTFLEEVGY